MFKIKTTLFLLFMTLTVLAQEKEQMTIQPTIMAIPFAAEGRSTRSLYEFNELNRICLLYTSPSPRDATLSRMPSSA